MAETDRLEIAIKAVNEASKALKEVQKDLGGVDEAAKKSTGIFAKLKGSWTEINQAMEVGKKVLHGVQIAWDAVVAPAMEAEKAMAATNAVLKSTGGVAGVTSTAVVKLADQLSSMAGIDDELIQSAENVMLTFTAIGKDVFPQAMEAALNMSVALGTDLQGSVIQVGKALQDPILGISALRRVGVNFDADAKKLIKTMVAMGDTAGAQAFILKELATEFGGAAEAAGSTATGKMQKFSVAVENLGEAVGTILLPALGDAAVAATNFLTVISDGISPVEDQQILIRQLAIVYGENSDAVKQARDKLAELMELEAQQVAQQERNIESSENEAQILRNLTGAFGEAKPAIDKVTLSEEELAEQTDKVSERMGMLKDIMAGAVGKELKDFKEAQEENRAKAAGLREEMAKLPEGTARWGEIKGQLSELDQAYADNAAAHEAATGRILFDIAARQLAMDGLTMIEVEALRSLAVEWGLMDEATANATRDVLGAVVQLSEDQSLPNFRKNMGDAREEALNWGADTSAAIDGIAITASDKFPTIAEGFGTMQGAADNAKGAVDGVTGSLNTVPTRVDVTIAIHTEGSIPSIPLPGEAVPFQHGGAFAAGAPIALHPPEIVMTPTASGFVVSQSDMRDLIGSLKQIAAQFGSGPSVDVTVGTGLLDQAIEVALGKRARAARRTGIGRAIT